MELTREQALALLRQYNEEPFHLRHALTVEAVIELVRPGAGLRGGGGVLGPSGLLHDLDFERYPESTTSRCVRSHGGPRAGPGPHPRGSLAGA